MPTVLSQFGARARVLPVAERHVRRLPWKGWAAGRWCVGGYAEGLEAGAEEGAATAEALTRGRVRPRRDTGTEACYPSDGPPGLRPVYDEGYRGAFLLDSDGTNVEAVCHNET